MQAHYSAFAHPTQEYDMNRVNLLGCFVAGVPAGISTSVSCFLVFAATHRCLPRRACVQIVHVYGRCHPPVLCTAAHVVRRKGEMPIANGHGRHETVRCVPDAVSRPYALCTTVDYGKIASF